MLPPSFVEYGAHVTLRCLIVDDSPAFLDAARRLLQQQGIEVVGVAATGDEAVRLANALRPHVTLLDIVLGDEDGLAVAQRLADDPDGSAGTVILVSTHDGEEFAEAIEASHAVGFISKPALSADAVRRLAGAATGNAGQAALGLIEGVDGRDA